MTPADPVHTAPPDAARSDAAPPVDPSAAVAPAGWRRVIPFKVDVAGIIEIMGSSLYSRATTPVRELIQNAHDGIVRRRERDLSFRGRIDVVQDAAAGTLTFADDGIGLDEHEADRYLGTLGVGITGLIKKGLAGAVGLPTDGPVSADASAPPADSANAAAGTPTPRPAGGQGLIGQFGVGLFSAFMLADRLVVETRKADGSPPVRWEAGAGTDITLAAGSRESFGTAVTLHLKPAHRELAADAAALEEAVKEYADFLPVPIHLNGSAVRANLVNAAWFDPTPDAESVALELESFFHEAPLDVIPIRAERPARVAGALYVTPQRTPGFSGDPVVTVTVRRMVIGRRIQRLLPAWASFLRGVLEVDGCRPTASREDLVRDDAFDAVRDALADLLYEHFELLAATDLPRLQAVIAWHRYALAGSALTDGRLRALLRRAYPFGTSGGPMTFDAVLAASAADPLFEAEASHVLWVNGDRRQEAWANGLFAAHAAPCVHAVRSFEEALLAAMAADAMGDGGDGETPVERVDLRPASPGSPNFAESVLGVGPTEEAPEPWQSFLAAAGARVLVGSFGDDRTPVMAFLNERHELARTIDDLRKAGGVPAGFQRLIDQHLAADRPARNEVLLNRRHPTVRRALDQTTTHHPLASVLRLLVTQALAAAGASVPPEARKLQSQDLDWVGEALAARGK